MPSSLQLAVWPADTGEAADPGLRVEGDYYRGVGWGRQGSRYQRIRPEGDLKAPVGTWSLSYYRGNSGETRGLFIGEGMSIRSSGGAVTEGSIGANGRHVRGGHWGVWSLVNEMVVE